MRQRPRLKEYTITCDWCATKVVKLLPARQAVRNKLSDLHFCSAAHQRKHWEARRRAAWSAVPYQCRRPGCLNEITPVQGPGRPKVYCSASCRTMDYEARASARDPAAAVLEARQEMAAALQRARRAGHELAAVLKHGRPVALAHEQARVVHQSETSIEAERNEAVSRIIYRLWDLTKPRFDAEEPDRRSQSPEDLQIWWSWWTKRRGEAHARFRLHCENLGRADDALLRAEKVRARRAETARLRRQRRSDVS